MSAAQSEANARNARKSTGPTSAAGKYRTCHNAYKHGLTGQIHVLTAEERQAFDAHCTGIIQALAPVGALEQDLARAIAEDRWRLNRARAVETAVFSAGQHGEAGGKGYKGRDLDNPADLILQQAALKGHTWMNQAKNLQLLVLYEQRINRTVEKNMAELRTLRAERQAACRQAMEEAQLLSQLALSKGEKYDAAADFPAELQTIGFEFSTAEIKLMQRLAEARAYAKNRKPGAPMAAAA
jgi:hypothetical protein